MRRILLTGAAGFIGWKTSKILLEEGAEVIGIDNLNEYYDIKLKNYRLEELNKNPNFKFYKIDIENYDALNLLFNIYTFNGVINLAARAGVSYSMINPHIYLSTNSQGTLNLLELMRAFGIKKMVLASTSSLYAGQPMPFKEDLPVNTPISPYAASKKAAEVMAYTYHDLYELDITVVRYFTVFGPAGRPDMSIFRFIKWIDEGSPIELFGDGTQSRDFTYVDDIAIGTVKALKKVGYEIINLGGGKKPISLNYVINKIEFLLNKKAKIEFKPFYKTDIKETWADITKAKNILNWEPQIGFDDGLYKCIEWYNNNKQLIKNIKL